MRCFYPIPAFRQRGGAVVFSEWGDIVQVFAVRCGRCIGCRLDRAQGWAVRCMHESELFDFSSFVTLTYDDSHCPVTLTYPHFQKFMKRVRRHFGPTRFFMCGEYGEQFRRPHFHALLFGVFFADRVVIRRTSGGFDLFESATLSRLWPYGFSSIGDVSSESAGYVARYSLKKVSGDGADAHYRSLDFRTGEVVQLEPEFCHMSLKPGIGSRWLESFRSDVYGEGKNVVRVGSMPVPIPKYYDSLQSEKFSDEYDALLLERYKNSFRYADDGSPERLAVQEQVARARISTFTRSL